MECKQYDRLSGLTTNMTNWRIKIRVTRIWPGFDRSTCQCKEYSMILLDDDVTILNINIVVIYSR